MRRTCLSLGALALSLVLVTAASADVRRAPVRLRYVGEPRVSPLGQTTVHTLEIRALEPQAVVTNLRVEGAGWSARLTDAPDKATVSGPSSFTVRLEVTPTDVSQPLTLRYEVDGVEYEKTVDLSPAAIERARGPRAVHEHAPVLDGKTPAAAATLVKPGLSAEWVQPAWAEPDRPADDSPGKDPGGERIQRTIRVHGRWVYDRNDGVTIGADGVTVRIYDEDGFPDPDDLLATTITDAYGYYDVSFAWDGGCFGCENDPDIYVEWETINSEVETEDATILETNYRWASSTKSNFAGSDLDKGTTSPSDESEHPALHLHTDLTRDWRWYLNNEGYDLPKVDAQWPEGSNTKCPGAWYDDGSEEIHICDNQKWDESTHAHEYGHHFMNNYAFKPATGDYCNGICDGTNCGHCLWCQETSGWAWVEGWPDWIGNVQATSYASTYGIAALKLTLNAETVGGCSGILDVANLTEGFIAAFLQDVWDSANDDDPNVGGTWTDQLFWGTNEIFDVVDFDAPVSAMDFITKLKNRYPGDHERIWETAKNCNFEMDVDPPGVPMNLVSTSHTPGVASPDPTITFTWTRPDDDWSGVAGYHVWLTNLDNGFQLDNTDIGDVTTWTTPILDPGSYRFSIGFTVDRAGRSSVGAADLESFVIREPEPSNLEPYRPAGWDHDVVPRGAPDAVADNVPDPATLPADSLATYWNFSVTNSGESGTSHQSLARLYVDGATADGHVVAKLAAGASFSGLNYGPITVPSGRHAFATVFDVRDSIAEIHENDNVYGRQWIWDPPSLAGSTEVTRAAPPDREGGWDQITSGPTWYNADGLRFRSGGNAFWHALYVSNPDPDEDYDCRLHFATANAETGFAANLALSSRAKGRLDAVLVNRYTMGNAEWDAGVINVSGGTSAYTARHVVSSVFAFGDSSEITLPSDRMLALREVNVPAGGPVSFTARIVSGSGPVYLLWLGDTFTAGGLLDYDGYAVASDTATTARIDVSIPNAGSHAFVLYRDPKDGTAPVTVVVEVGTTPPDLTPFLATGWYAPLVPRPLDDAVAGSVPAPDTLDGNANATFLSYAVRDDSPTGATGLIAQIGVDGVDSWSSAYAPINPNATVLAFSHAARNIRGGRHTLSVYFDEVQAIEEKYEDNNSYGEQWVWSPLPLSLDTPVTRVAPPDRTGGWSQITSGERWFNCDGLRTPDFSPTGDDGWWGAISVMPGAASDVDVRLHEREPGAVEGFRANLGVSGWDVGQSDFSLVDFRETSPRGFDAGVLNREGTESYTAEAVTSTFRGTDPVGLMGPFTLGPDHALQLHEFWLDPATYVIEVFNESGSVDWGVSLHEPDAFQTKSTHLVSSYLDHGAGGAEDMPVTISTAGYYCVAVWKVGAADLPLAGSYMLQVQPVMVDAPVAVVATTAFGSAFPNPMRGRSTLSFALAQAGEVRLEIYDVHGARVRTLAQGRWPAGRHTVDWQGDDDRGRPVPAGVYLARFGAAGVEARRKLVRLE